jgi:dTDP-glucose 4,6-dehydratase
MKRILIVGGAGFIGSNLADALLIQGHEVVCLDNLCTGQISNLENAKNYESFEFVHGDVITFDFSGLGQFDFIYHLASPASPPKYLDMPDITMWSNTLGTKRILDYAEATSARVLFASTSEVYGDPLVSPQSEEYWGNVNPIGPRSVYDEAKRFGETIIRQRQSHNPDVAVIVRIFNTYGPKMDPFDGRVVSTFIRQTLKSEPLTIYGDGSQTRSFCYISDLVVGLQRAIESKEIGPINLGNPNEITLNQLVEEIASVTGRHLDVIHLELPQDDPTNRKPDIQKAKDALAWVPAVDLASGLAYTFTWMTNSLEL